MTPDEFRQHGRAVIDWIADYMERVESLPVLSSVQPGEIRTKLPPAPPAAGEPFERILADIDQLILPGITHWQSPNFFAYFPANTSGPSVLGELMSAGLGIQGMLWSTSPACTELETHVLDWMAQLLDLPQRFASTGKGGGVIQDSASSAVLCALVAARDRQPGERRTVYASTEAHSMVEKAVMISGIGRENLRTIQVDEQCAMRPDALRQAITTDRRNGYTPCFVNATVGTTSSHAVEPVRAIGEICQEHGAWFHVDAAMAGVAAACEEFRWIHDGLELADSYCTNPHKWMLTNFDCDCFWVADREPLLAALSILPEYLRNKATESGAVIDYRDWQVPLGRRFRALKLWFVLRWYGVEGIRRHLRSSVAAAQQLVSWIEADDRFEMMAAAPLNLVCFRHRDGDAVNERLLETLNASGDMFLSHTRLNDKFTLRMALGSTMTQLRHVEKAWARISEAAP
jgi:aromatic-L-amino-acid decarboxylase